MASGNWPPRVVLSPQVDHEVRITEKCFPTVGLGVPSHPSPGGRRLAFPICTVLSFGKELLPSVLWTVKQVFINKLR